MSVSGRFKDRIVPEITNADRGKFLSVKGDKNGTTFTDPHAGRRFVVADWNEARAYPAEGHELPINYGDYHELLYVTMNAGDKETKFAVLPVAALQDARRDSTNTDEASIGESNNDLIKFNRTTRKLERVNSNLARFAYLELRK